jgi:hypothetical protein
MLLRTVQPYAVYREWDTRCKQCHGCEYRDWESKILPLPCQSERDASWLRLFDPAIPERSWRRGGTADREAVVDILLEKWIRKVTPFEGRREYYGVAWDGVCPA